MAIPSQVVIQEHPLTALIDASLAALVKVAEKKIAYDKSEKIQLAGFLERETVRKQSEIDDVNAKIESNIKDLQDMSGALYALPKNQQTGTASTVQRDINMPIVKSLQKFSKELEVEQARLDEQLNLILGEVADAKLVQDWFSGVGHTPEGGIDKFRWDIGDFTEQEFEEYAKEYGIPEGTDRSAFVKGAISKGRNVLHLKMIGLNKMLDQARTTELTTKVTELNYARTLSSTTEEDLKKLQKARDEDIYALVKPYSLASSNTGLNRAIMASALGGLEEGDRGYEDAVKVSNKELEIVGASVTNNVNARKSNFELGSEIVSGNMRFKATSEHETNISRTDYTGWTRSLEKIYHHAINNEGQLSPDQFKDYKRRISKIVGMEYNYFMESFYPAMEKGLEDHDKDAISQTVGTLNKSVSSTGYPTFDEHFRDLYRGALTSKTVSGETEFINKHQVELWKMARDKYGYTYKEFKKYLDDF